MISITHLELQNFLSHVDTKIDFHDYNGLVLIEGVSENSQYSSNGSGKSTILEGIVYALTGDTLRGVSVNDVVNRNYKKNTRVTLRFTRDDIEYEISRYRKDDKMGDAIVLRKDGEDISKRVNKETQQSIDDILGISYKILISTILLGEGLSSRFTQLSDPEKKSLIESTLNLNYDMNELRARANSKLSQLKLDSAQLSGKISSLREYVTLDVDASEERIKTLEEMSINANTSLEGYNTTARELESQISTINDKLILVKTSIDQVDRLTQELARTDAEEARLIEELTATEKCEVPHCTTCHQALSSEDSRESFRASYKERIDAVANRAKEIRDELSKLPDRSVLCQTYDKLSSQISDIQTQLSTTRTTILDLNNTVYQMSSDIKNLRHDIYQYNEAIGSIESMESDYKEYESQIARYDYFYKLFSPTGIIVNILSDAIGYLNERISAYSEVLLDKRYHISFLKGKVALVDESGASYQSLSNGEKKRLDLTIQFALHDYVVKYCGNSFNIMLIDEVMDTLDDVGTNNIIEVLRLKLEYCDLSRILVITHNNELKSYFDRVITILKDRSGDSKII